MNTPSLPLRLARPLVPALVTALLMSGVGPRVWAADDERREQRQDNRQERRQDQRQDQRQAQRQDHRQDRHEAHRGAVVVAPQRGAPPRWVDNAHGHRRVYPPAGWVVHTPPPRARRVVWGGVPYWYDAGVWYSHGPRGYAVIRPPRGLVVFDLPSFRSVVLVAGLAYLYANGTYYLERPQGGYEVVDAPSGAVRARGLLVENGGSPAPVDDKLFIYPSRGQSAQQQASDEYDCHRWARNQTGFDPSATALGQAAAGSASDRADYSRAQSACLDARGYTVR